MSGKLSLLTLLRCHLDILSNPNPFLADQIEFPCKGAGVGAMGGPPPLVRSYASVGLRYTPSLNPRPRA